MVRTHKMLGRNREGFDVRADGTAMKHVFYFFNFGGLHGRRGSGLRCGRFNTESFESRLGGTLSSCGSSGKRKTVRN